MIIPWQLCPASGLLLPERLTIQGQKIYNTDGGGGKYNMKRFIITTYRKAWFSHIGY